MKRIQLTLAFILLAAGFTTLSAQKQDNYKLLQQKRVEFLIQKMDLTVGESQKFWPLFNEYYEKRHELSVENRAKYGDQEMDPKITEKDFLNAINGILDYKEKQAQLTNTYYQQYLQILSAEKVYKLYQLEEEFNKILLKQLKDYPKDDKQNQKKRN
jgi:hypothetical protein